MRESYSELQKPSSMISSLNFRPEFVIEAKFEMNGYRMLKSPNIASGSEKSKSNTFTSSLKVREIFIVVTYR